MTQDNLIALKPCPFCGSADISHGADDDATAYFAFCSDCGAQGPWNTEQDEARKEWNTRLIERLSPPLDGEGVIQAVAEWNAMIEAEAEATAERENEASSHCGPNGTDTADDYRDEIRAEFEAIGKAYVAAHRRAATISTPREDEGQP